MCSVNSKIFTGRVRHRRFKPKENEFQYTIFMLYLDLDELPTLFDRFWLWSLNKPNVASFQTQQYLADENGCIKTAVKHEVKTQLGVVPKGPIRLLTHLSYFGYCFNPVSFYYCFNEDGETLDFIVAQINNTPWNERHCYVLDNRPSDASNSPSKVVRSEFEKTFHVSPFLPMDMRYFWRFNTPSEKLAVYMKNTQDDETFFDVNLSLKRKEINSLNLCAALVKFPLMTWQVITGIYWQSLKLWLRKTPFYDHPKTHNTK
ncbi:DUF1365 domain-containing protein [Cycloclasticus sp.]|uniref:DUF1365 domain-containing protein n=1 Tax=Cycloclasticus sp. TaxID=2024830 RepID=UPI000C0C9451|nr:DUF1365 domain-containing protein [Cycloclasticus sp.]PHR51924.1 MAG: chromosome partitioning protein ParA [Cycloclasticus sp.]